MRVSAASAPPTTRTILPKAKVPSTETLEDPEIDKKFRRLLATALHFHDPDLLEVWEE